MIGMENDKQIMSAKHILRIFPRLSLFLNV